MAASSPPQDPGTSGAAGGSPARAPDELRAVEAEVDQVRRTVTSLREQLADPGGAIDPADHATALTAVEEQEALLGTLMARRDELRRSR